MKSDNSLVLLGSKNDKRVFKQFFEDFYPSVCLFANDGSCTITQAAGSSFTITGSGTFKSGADEWGNKKRDAIHLTYKLTSGAYTYSATDTLVVRDRTVKMQVYKPVVF